MDEGFENYDYRIFRNSENGNVNGGGPTRASIFRNLPTFAPSNNLVGISIKPPLELPQPNGVIQSPLSLGAHHWTILIKQLVNFEFVRGLQYVHHFPESEIMRVLINLNPIPNLFKVETEKVYNRTAERSYKTKITFSNSVGFTGFANKKSESRGNARKIVYRRLMNLSILFSHFKRDYYPQMTLDDFKRLFFVHNSDVLKIKTEHHSDHDNYRTTISLVHFSDFYGVSTNQEQSQLIAIRKLMIYTRAVICRLD